VGAGYLNIAAALSNNDLALLPALSPKAVYDPSAQKTGIIRNFSVTWGDSVLWGDSVVFGAFVFSRLAVTATDQSVLWGDSVCWGDSSSSGFSVLWGDSLNGASTPTALAVDGSDM